MRAVKVIAIFTILLALASFAGCGVVAMMMLDDVQAGLAGLQTLPQPSYEAGMTAEDILAQGQAGIESTLNAAMEKVMESQTLLVLLFCLGIVFLLITLVLIILLRPERRSPRYEDEWG